MNTLSKKESENLSSLIASLAYLESESHKLGFKEISLKLSELLREIKGMVESGSYEVSVKIEKIRKSELFQTLIAIEKIAAYKELNFEAVNEAIDTFDVISNSDKKVSH